MTAWTAAPQPTAPATTPVASPASPAPPPPLLGSPARDYSAPRNGGMLALLPGICIRLPGVYAPDSGSISAASS